MKNRWIIRLLFVVQGLFALFFLSDIVLSALGIYNIPISWSSRELLEIGASVGLLLGLVFGAVLIRQQSRDLGVAQAKLQRASLQFLEHLDQRFAEWQLTPAERDVALFAIKGLSTAEIAECRQTSEGTVKSQTNAIYRKAGVSGRSQLLSIFIDDLMTESAPMQRAAE